MATNYPTGLDTNSTLGPNVSNATPINDPVHEVDATHKNNTKDAVIATQTKVGIDGSTDPTSLEYRVDALESGGASYPPLISIWQGGSGLQSTVNINMFNTTYGGGYSTKAQTVGISHNPGNGLFTISQSGVYLMICTAFIFGGTSGSPLDLFAVYRNSAPGSPGTGTVMWTGSTQVHSAVDPVERTISFMFLVGGSPETYEVVLNGQATSWVQTSIGSTMNILKVAG